eukprot:TRINITY_DN10360_c0_g1_i1.p1 TRINITY_DN10360_c0_g1~~TRINITY_DN10360_c0_g1_i1.p1  ORF type:complete len:201 (+),score=58.57 TRINITY_DN10360_c0_g1_i1:167-769(+)
MWSIGVILYVLLNGEVPFYGENDAIIAERIKLGKYQFDCNTFILEIAPVWESISEECKNLINLLLMPAEDRLGPEDIMQHAWVKKMEESTELPPLSPERLKLFNSVQKVKKVIFKYLSNELGVSRVGQLKKWLMNMDKCGDGILSVEEVRKGLADYSQKELEPWIEILDATGEGIIDYGRIFYTHPSIHCGCAMEGIMRV